MNDVDRFYHEWARGGDNMGYPAELEDGTTVEIVEKHVEGAGLAETFIDANGNVYTRSIRGDAYNTLTLVPVEAPDGEAVK